jgi:hypothetical protein
VDMMNLIIQLLLMLLLPFSIPQFVLASNNENRYRAIAESFNFAAAGDWNDINNTYEKAQTIDPKNPEIVLGLRDFAYDQDMYDIMVG